MYLKDSSGKPSVTHTAFVIGFLVACVKLLISGVTVGGFTAEQFSGGDFAAVAGSLGAIYTMRRNMGNTEGKKEE